MTDTVYEHETIVDETDGKNVLETLPFELETAQVRRMQPDRAGQPTSGLFFLLGVIGVGGLGAVMAAIYIFAGVYA